MAKTIKIFDPPMCCPTGVCGPSVDPALTKLGADLEWLKSKGVTVERYNLAQQPDAFAKNPLVRSMLQEKGNDSLPLIIADNSIVKTGSYPTRSEFTEITGIESESASASLIDAKVKELIAIGAAIACNCEPCFKYHFDEARKLGVSKEDMKSAVDVAQIVKESPAKSILKLAGKHLKAEESSETESSCCSGSGCC